MKTSLALVLGTAVAIQVGAQPLADSVAEFSGTQGANSWYYGLYNASADFVPGYDPKTDFTRFPQYSNGSWYISSAFWTSLGAQYIHPNNDGSNDGKTPQEHWPVLRWVSEVTGLVYVHGRLAKVGPGGDGVMGMVFVNGRKVFERSITGGETAGVEYSFGVGVRAGDFVDFALSDAGTSSSDGSIFTAVIERADFALNTTTAIEVSVPTVSAQRYQMFYSADLGSWSAIGQPFTGTGDTMYFLYSIRELGSPGFFKVEALP